MSQFERVASEQKKKLVPLSEDLLIVESGLDSLCLAIIIARLHDSLGFDPFDSPKLVSPPATLGEFIKFYEDVGKDL